MLEEVERAFVPVLVDLATYGAVFGKYFLVEDFPAHDVKVNSFD